MHTDNEDLKIPEEIRRLISGAKRHHSMRTPKAWWGCSRMAPTMQP